MECISAPIFTGFLDILKRKLGRKIAPQSIKNQLECIEKLMPNRKNRKRAFRTVSTGVLERFGRLLDVPERLGTSGCIFMSAEFPSARTPLPDSKEAKRRKGFGKSMKTHAQVLGIQMNNDKAKEVRNKNQVKKKNAQSLDSVSGGKQEKEQVMQMTILNL